MATQGIQVSVEKDLGTAVIGGVKVEVSPDSNVTVYTNDGVRTKPVEANSAVTKGTHISEDFNTVVLNGATIEQASGYLVITTPGVVVTKPLPANDAKPKAEPKPGDRMEDGTIFAGISPDRHQPMYTTPSDAPLTMRWRAAMNYAANLDAYSHKDWRAPTKGELNVLFNNRAAIGGFNVTGSIPAGWYWSSTESNDYGAWVQRFGDGDQGWYFKGNASSLRCVR